MKAWLELIPTFGKLLDRILPDPASSAQAKLELMRLAQTGELAELDADVKIAQGQAAINLEDAKQGGLFRAGWRPLLGWVGALSVAWEWLCKPVFLTLWALSDAGPAPMLPTLNVEQILGLVAALLGLGGFRTWERVRGKA